MSTFRENPYSKFKFLVSFVSGQGSGEPGQIVGGFSDASGLGMDVNYPDYRNGNERSCTARIMPGTGKFAEVTLKRGLVGGRDVIQWINTVRAGTADPRQVQITVRDAARNPVVTLTLHNSRPTGYTGSALAAKGEGEVAVEELSLTYEGIEYK